METSATGPNQDVKKILWDYRGNVAAVDFYGAPQATKLIKRQLLSNQKLSLIELT